jgi:DNA polymerase-3 subunit gamma/tau
VPLGVEPGRAAPWFVLERSCYVARSVSYVVLARKYRPMRFADMVGQEHIGRTLGNAIKQDRVHHAYLFSGARGLGKTTTARIFAKGLVCVQGPTAEPCNACSECVAVSEGRSVDVLEIDGASNNSVDDIRNLREQVSYLPQTARRKVYIIDEVHMLSTSAFNALLKTLEEPPPHVNFVFATTEPQKVLPTILSRVNRLDFKRVAPGELGAYLRRILDAEGLGVEDGGLRIISRASEGSVRDALTLLDQVIAFAEDPKHVAEEEVRRLLGQADASVLQGLVESILDGDPTATMRRFDALVTAGNDLAVLGLQVLELLRDLTVLRVCGTAEVLPDATEAEIAQLRALASKVEPTHLGQLFDRFSRVIDRLPQSRTQRLLVEMGLLELACAEPVMPLGDLVDRLHAIGRGAPPPAAGGRGGGTPRAASTAARGQGSGGAAAGFRAEARDGGFVPPEPPAFERGEASRGRGFDGGFVPPEPPAFERSDGASRGRGFDGGSSRAPRLEPPSYDEPPPPTHGLPPEPPPYDEPPPSVRFAMPEPSFDAPSPARRPSPSLSVVPAPSSAAASPFMSKLLDMGMQSGMVAEAAQLRPSSSPPAVVPTRVPPVPERGPLGDAEGARAGTGRQERPVVARAPEPPAAMESRAGEAMRTAEPAPVEPRSPEPSPAPARQERAVEAPVGPEIRIGVGPCLPPPPAQGVIPWETLEPLVAWEQLVTRIRESDDILAAMLGQVGLVKLAAGVLRVAALRGSLVHTQISRQPEVRAQVEQATRDHLGAPFTLELVEGDPEESDAFPSLDSVVKQRRAEHRARVEAEAKAHPGIQTLLRLFDGQLLATKPLQEA